MHALLGGGNRLEGSPLIHQTPREHNVRTINIISVETWKETHNYGFNFQLTIQGGPINVNFDLSLLIISTSLTVPNDKINVDERRQI